MLKILLAAGHGPGDNRGGVCYNEGDNNFYYSLALKKELDTYGNVQTDLLRKSITDNPSLTERAEAGSGYDLYFAIHSNAFSDPAVRGTEIWDSVEKPNNMLARAICDATVTLFRHNDRGVKYRHREDQTGVNYYGELRYNKAKSAMIAEMGFHTNLQDCNFFKNNHEALAEAQASAIANYYKLKKKPVGFPIISKTQATAWDMQEWAKRKNANETFVILAPIYFAISEEVGVNPLVTYCQSAKETGYMKFGGVLDASYFNPCGLKTTAGGDNKDPNAHQRFRSWEEGIRAQVDHLALYAGAPGYPKQNTPDPRHFPYIKGTALMVEDLSGKWASSLSYGTDIVKMIREIEATVKEIDTEQDGVVLSAMGVILHGKEMGVEGASWRGINYLPADLLEKMGYRVSQADNTIQINYKED